ncbi:hypothetical protein QTJ16_002618 [Diplocarpon rosae]|uniref:Mediator of RNA polymerase II transcription subunit 13 n=1 Tax=Diplocarpon rosae TaxID=946125 RepID=A0AAD9T2N8_9HELO|nr:hypothetical protein QTJ16_002618 [Diplocarpon rosae]
MEPGECLSNVISFNNFASINYEYFESQTAPAGSARDHLQRTEAGWRQEGRLVQYDPYRDGIWLFQNVTGTGSPTKHSEISAVDVQGLGLLLKDKGTYDPASLARGKQASNVLTTPSTSSSPSSSLESALRNAQALNARSVQANFNLGLVQDSPTPSPGLKPELHNSLKDIHENFISSVLSSTVYFLCYEHGFIPLNSRTLILPFSNSSPLSFRPRNSIELATLDISLTSLGVLVIKAHADMAPGLQTSVSATSSASIASELSPGSSLWLAPSGSAAKLHSIPDEKKLPESMSMAQLQEDPLESRSSGTNSLTIKAWQSRCLEWLSAKGLNSTALEAGGWIHVQILGGHNPYYNGDTQAIPILDESAIVPWPALLCFQTSNSRFQDAQLNGSGSWPCRDPLSFAEDWFTSGDERAATVSNRQKERQAVEALSKEQADLETRALQSNTYSPTALRRSSNAGAMYPTPPDAPQPHVGATPSFDGNASTPGNPNQLITHDAGSVVPSNRSTADVDSDLWGSSSKKERRSSGNTYNDNEKDNDHDNDNGNENLFGDIGGDMFGTHITDDDFNFFDEPDVDELDQKAPSPLPGNLPEIQEEAIMSKKPFPSEIMIQVLETHDAELPSTDHGAPSRQTDNSKNSQPTGITAQISSSEQSNDNVEAVKSPRPYVSLPFSKEVIFQRLDQERIGRKNSKQFRRASLFSRIVFEESLQSVNKKYSSHGQFSFSSKKTRKHEIVPGLPETDYLSSRRKPRDRILEMRNVARIIGEKKLDCEPNIRDPMDHLLASDESSPMSEQDDSSHATEESLVSPLNGMKRKWESDEQDDIASTFDGLAMDFEVSASTPQSASGSQMPLLDADPADWALATYFTTPEPDVDAELNVLTDLERIATAQILADQAIWGTLRLPDTASNETSMLADATSATRQLMHSLTQALKSCLKDGNTCTMRSFMDIQGIPVLNQALRLPPRPMQNLRGPIGQDARPNTLFPIPPPQLEVRRSDMKMSILPASVPFWENLGLGPSKGTKDVNAVCVYPNFDGLAMCASAFLDQMKSVYESSRFGTHDRLVSKEIGNGLLPFAIDLLSQDKMQYLAVLRETVSRLSRNLASSTAGEKNYVIYFVYPVDNKVLLVHICSAFQHLFNLYRKAVSERRPSSVNELVLQLVPMDLIASPTSVAVPLPSKYFKLSMEVYDRCINFSSSTSSPAIMLEQPLPRTIDFKLSVNPSASVLQENTCLHIAYAQSIDDRWITAAWTDNMGTQQMTASYCLGRKNEPISTPFTDVANEIWETTLQILLSQKIHWRIIIARVGVMDNSELDFWIGLASTESNAQISLTLVTVQTNPSLRLLPAPVTLTPNGSTAQSVITPVSTPQALQTSIGSPDTATTPIRGVPTSVSTPVEAPIEPDSDARLVDYADRSWGAVLSHRLNNSNSLVESNPALISGYLLKRGGLNNNDPPIVMEVNIVHSEVVGNPRTFHESILREVLGYYRGLGTLARTRGVVDAVKDIRPWHIAAAEKAVKALYMLM